MSHLHTADNHAGKVTITDQLSPVEWRWVGRVAVYNSQRSYNMIIIDVRNENGRQKATLRACWKTFRDEIISNNAPLCKKSGRIPDK